MSSRIGRKGKVRYRGRLRVDGIPSYYHCMSRVVAGAHLLGTREKEIFRKMLRKQAIFCGVEVITFAVMSNHFHLMVRVVPLEELSDVELVERVGVLYGEQEAKVAASYLASEEEGPALRESLVSRMGDVSVFLKELKQRFSIWYNKTHERFGTLWAERFKSVLLEPERHVLCTVAAYIDLNPVRAGICDDPAHYRFCGYSEAVAGRVASRQGLQRIYGASAWADTQSAYRLVLFGEGYHRTREGKGRITEEALRQVLKAKGELTLAEVLRCRVRYFSEGMALGSAAFVEELFARVKERYGWKKRQRGAIPLKECRPSGLHTLNRMSGDAIG